MKFLVVDCEACNCPKIDGQLDVKNGMAYDLGGQVIDEKGKVFEEFSFVIEDVFFGMPQAMSEAFFADKIPQYLVDMRMGRHQILNVTQASWYVRQLCVKYNIKCVVAHNAHFDVTVLNSTLRYHTQSRKRYFFPYGIRILDSMKIARQVLKGNKSYIEFCEANELMTNHVTPRPRFTAEALWRYMTQDVEFEELHTGLADVTIESGIFTKCLEALRHKAF